MHRKTSTQLEHLTEARLEGLEQLEAELSGSRPDRAALHWKLRCCEAAAAVMAAGLLITRYQSLKPKCFELQFACFSGQEFTVCL